MKKLLFAFLSVVILISLFACQREASGNLTIKELLTEKDFPAEETMTVTVKDIINPVLAVVEDDSGETVNLFGVFLEGDADRAEMKDFESQGISVGSTITIKDGKYNEYDGSVEIFGAILVSVQ